MQTHQLAQSFAGLVSNLLEKNKAFLDKVVAKSGVTVRFKSTSVKSKGGKTGEYRYWTVIALGVKKLEEELEYYNGLISYSF